MSPPMQPSSGYWEACTTKTKANRESRGHRGSAGTGRGSTGGGGPAGTGRGLRHGRGLGHPGEGGPQGEGTSTRKTALQPNTRTHTQDSGGASALMLRARR